LNKGESRFDTLKLYKDYNDTVPCVIIKHIYCELEDTVKSCTPDCDSVKWKTKTLASMPLPNCPDCWLSAVYSYRKNTCTDKQEIQVLSFTTQSAVTNHTACSLCNMSADVIYKLALKRAIFGNGTGFDPKPSDPLPFPGNCYNTWRVIQASCWIDYIDYFWHPDSSVVIYKPCDSTECCSIGLTVCRISADPPAHDYISITPNGTPSGGDSCLSHTRKVYDPAGLGFPHVNPDGSVSYGIKFTLLPCQDRCEWLNISDSEFNNYEYYGKVSFNDLDFQTINPGDELKLNIIVKKDFLDCYILSNIKTENCNIAIYNILGQPLINSIYNLKKGINDFSLNIDNLNSGMYIIQVNVDGIIQKTEKFIIVK
jgi:hypothetical protein